jgi:hypothetical protein
MNAPSVTRRTHCSYRLATTVQGRYGCPVHGATTGGTPERTGLCRTRARPVRDDGHPASAVDRSTSGPHMLTSACFSLTEALAPLFCSGGGRPVLGMRQTISKDGAQAVAASLAAVEV